MNSPSSHTPIESNQNNPTVEVGDTHIEWETQRDVSKTLGDTAFRQGQHEIAIQHYTEALSLDPDHAALLSNRSAAYLLTSQKSKALHDAERCVQIGTMGLKGISRLAAALQSLGRYEKAKDEWERILLEDPNHIAALKGQQDCVSALIISTSLQQEQSEHDTTTASKGEGTNLYSQPTPKNEEDDLLDDFFNDVQKVTKQVIQAKESDGDIPPQIATNAIKNRKDLGTVESQIERILPNDNYFWYNLNPFHVLDVSHTDTIEEISRRYKALSLLLHPDKNPGLERAQDAYDEVLRAKAILLSGDENKVNYMRSLVEQGMRQGKQQWEKTLKEEPKSSTKLLLEEYQSKAVMKIFAEIENKRRQVEKNEQKHRQRERQQEEEELQKEKNSRLFEKKWQEENRVDKRVGNWHDFREKKNKKQS
jgi:DnaJ homolog subfamily C member 8